MEQYGGYEGVYRKYEIVLRQSNIFREEEHSIGLVVNSGVHCKDTESTHC